jgi:hypothetical protein
MCQRNHVAATSNLGIGISISYWQNEVTVTVYVKHWAIQHRSSIPVQNSGKRPFKYRWIGAAELTS